MEKQGNVTPPKLRNSVTMNSNESEEDKISKNSKE
jgi:hypothetical protein